MLHLSVARRARYTQGFTLLELVIVLAIAGVIFGGLWSLLAGGSSQLQAQTAAQQYKTVVEATRKFLPAADGPFYQSIGGGVTTAPTDVPLSTLITAGYLPNNFSTTDAFGQTIKVTVERTTPSDNTKWKFSVRGTGGSAISDKTGAQVASLIGSDGGFVYKAATPGCANTAALAAQRSCGAYGAFTLNFLTDFVGFNPSTGHVATLSYTTDSSLAHQPWLARFNIGDPAFNTISVNTQFKDATNQLAMNGSTIAMGSGIGATTGGGALALNGGSLSLAASAAATGTGTMYLADGQLTGHNFTVNGQDVTMSYHNLTLNSTTSIDVQVGGVTGAFNITGPKTTDLVLSINGLGRADTFQARQFIYTSDASLKANFAPIVDALGKLMQIHGLFYDWRSGGGGKQMGLLAQDVQKVFPEIVAPIGEGKLGVDYGKLVAPIIEGMRQLKAENEALRAELEQMKKDREK